MSAPLQGPYTSVARKWLALAQRRRAHFNQLIETGRWRYYFTPAELKDEIGKADGLCAVWAGIAGLVLDGGRWVAPRAEAMLPPAGRDGGLDSRLAAQASHRAMLREALGLLPA